MKYTTLLVSLLIASEVFAADTPSTQDQCEQLVNAYGELQVAVKQSRMAGEIQQGIIAVCKRLIDAEQKAAAAEELKKVDDKKESTVKKQ